MDIQIEKLNLIHWIAGLTDEGTVNQIKSIQQEATNEDIPQWQKDILDERLKEHKENPDTALDFNQAMNDIEKDL